MPSSPETRGSVRSASAVSAPQDAVPLVLGSDPRAGETLDGFRTGRREGYEVGLAEGRADARAEVAGAIAALDGVMARARDRTQQNRAEVEELAIALAVELAEVIIGRELATDPVGPLVARALSVRTGREPVRIHVHPDDAAVMDDAGHPEIAIVADPSLARGAVTAEIGDGVADISIPTAIARVREALA